MLLAAGHHRPRTSGQWRVRSDVLEELAAQYHSMMYISEYAREQGVGTDAILRRVRAAGHRRGEYGCGRKMPRKVLDDVMRQFPLTKVGKP